MNETSRNVFNPTRLIFSPIMTKRGYDDRDERIHIPGRKTIDEVFDESTLKVLYRLMTQDVFEYIDYPISTGKEAKVFRGMTRDGDAVAIKVMRINTAVFKDYRQYIEGDYRFKKVGRGRKMVFTWTRKEFSNLKRMHEGGLPVPRPINVNKNVIVMECLESQGETAPMLKSLKLEEDLIQEIHDKLVDYLVKLVREVKLVHGDLSEYNILMVEDEPYMIDVSQSVPLTHPLAQDLFERDVDNLVRYFSGLGVETTREFIIDKVRIEEMVEDD